MNIEQIEMHSMATPALAFLDAQLSAVGNNDGSDPIATFIRSVIENFQTRINNRRRGAQTTNVIYAVDRFGRNHGATGSALDYVLERVSAGISGISDECYLRAMIQGLLLSLNEPQAAVYIGMKLTNDYVRHLDERA